MEDQLRQREDLRDGMKVEDKQRLIDEVETFKVTEEVEHSDFKKEKEVELVVPWTHGR